MHSIRVAPIALAIAVAFVISSCDDGTKGIETPLFEAAPQAFVFPKLAVGQSVEQDVVLINRGAGTLSFKDIELRDESTKGEYALFLRDDDGNLEDAPDRLELPGGDERRLTLTVRYAPSDDQDDRGEVRFETNDEAALRVTLPIRSEEQGAEIRVSPTTVEFGQVEAGTSAAETVKLTNIGQGNLVVSRITIDGSGDFSARYGDRELAGDLGEAPLTVAPGENIELEVIYSPETLGADLGELKIESNDRSHTDAEGRAVVAVNLRANGAAPCIRLRPEDIEFGAALVVEGRDVETPNKQFLSIESCGTTALSVTGLRFADENDVFGLTTEFVSIDLPAATPGGEPPSEVVEVGFWPIEERAFGGMLMVESNASVDPIEVPLFGRGVDNACPIPAAVTTEFHVQPLDIITLDGSLSTDPGGDVVRWEWTVVSRPDGSVSQPVETFDNRRRPADGGVEDNDSTPTALFFVDLAGNYEIELRVFDNLGQVSCDPNSAARVVVEAIPEKDLHVQLVWSTPEDPDESDQSGTDVDLHVRHERGGNQWSEAAGDWDCYFLNPEPDWGVEGDFADNPTLDIDDTNGAGPENINLARPENGVVYDVAALYYRAQSAFGQPDLDAREERLSLVTVRIFAHGELLGEWIDRELTSVNQLWRVASLTWCEDPNRCPTVDVIDNVLEEGER